MIQVTPIILCGGSGTRLWPLSRTGFPKQFLSLTEKDSLFQQAAQRLVGLDNNAINVAPPLIVTGEEHRFLAVEQLREAGIKIGAALLEPLGRNTAPALTLAALAAVQSGSDPVLVVTPADQTIMDAVAFTESTQSAINQATQGSIVILGVIPSRPETGYGYVQVEAGGLCEVGKLGVHFVKRFVEKPDTVLAQQYLTEGGYYWNAGMFVLKASIWLKAIELFRPDIYLATLESWNRRSSDSSTGTLFVRPGKAEFTATPAESVDYAVMERCPGSPFTIKMVTLDAGWNDMGAWDAVWKVLPKDEYGNSHVGDVLTANSHNNLVHASSRLVSLVGVQDLIVVETSDAVLVSDKSRSQDVKHIFAQLKNLKREEHAIHRKVYRPWGWYDIIDEGDFFKVKRILVKSGASLSLQKHNHRAEHWIVVKGTAQITIGNQVLNLTENQSIYIPIGKVHRLANLKSEPVEIIEVQTGSYLGEDDIVRLQDQYNRS
jgi:mannose-1-phosphate guanylyltransferase/mannose-6-phosphate isomerase